jgi:phage terminase large subunit-like protein
VGDGWLALGADRIDEWADPAREFVDAWRAQARPEQLPPEGEWRTAYYRGGRGAGKTWTAAHILAEWVLSDPEPGEWGIVAPTYPDAWSVCVEGESGLLAAFGTSAEEVRRGASKLVEHWHRSFAEIRMRSGHIVRVASASDGGLRIQGKNLKGAWCIGEGEPVTTLGGQVPVEAVRPGMQVWTRQGWREVTAHTRIRQDADLVRVITAGGASVRVTPEHRIWERRGWTPAGSLVPGDHLSVWAGGTALVNGTAVAEVAPAGHADVYDLTVDGAHEFVAGGILVHNCDEIGLWDNWETTWDESLKYAVRKGEARIIATGTPKKSRKARKLVKRLIDDPKVPVARLRTIDNTPNLSQRFLDEVVGSAKGTRLEQQELEGVLLDDVEGALWTAETIEDYRVKGAPGDLLRVIVAVDPAVSSGDDSDEAGIIVIGEGEGGHGFVLADYSMRGTPDEWIRKAVWAYHHHQADCVVAEKNNGGDFIPLLLHTVDTGIQCRLVWASRGKRTRAEPVSALYEQGRIHHCGVFTMLEEQMVSWVPTDPDSPDRVDALCWGVHELKGLTAGSWLAAYGTVRCEDCQAAYPESYGACPRCHPELARRPARTTPAETGSAPGETQALTGWASAYGAVRCPQGHTYIAKTHKDCPRCAPGIGGGGASRAPRVFPALITRR